jgi:four helix bundle protein
MSCALGLSHLRFGSLSFIDRFRDPPMRRSWGSSFYGCGTSVAANYRASCRARSRAEFAARIGIVVEEADESGFWLEMLAEAGIIRMALLKELLEESKELTAIFTATQHIVRKRN